MSGVPKQKAIINGKSKTVYQRKNGSFYYIVNGKRIDWTPLPTPTTPRRSSNSTRSRRAAAAVSPRRRSPSPVRRYRSPFKRDRDNIPHYLISPKLSKIPSRAKVDRFQQHRNMMSRARQVPQLKKIIQQAELKLHALSPKRIRSPTRNRSSTRANLSPRYAARRLNGNIPDVLLQKAVYDKMQVAKKKTAHPFLKKSTVNPLSYTYISQPVNRSREHTQLVGPSFTDTKDILKHMIKQRLRNTKHKKIVKTVKHVIFSNMDDSDDEFIKSRPEKQQQQHLDDYATFLAQVAIEQENKESRKTNKHDNPLPVADIDVEAELDNLLQDYDGGGEYEDIVNEDVEDGNGYEDEEDDVRLSLFV